MINVKNTETSILKDILKSVPKFSILIEKYEFLGLDEEEYKQLFTNSLLSFEKQNTHKSFDEVIYKEVRSKLNYKVYMMLQDETKRLIVINNYINSKIKRLENKLESLKLLDKFFQIFKFRLDILVSCDILKSNPYVYGVIESLVSKNMNLIKNKRWDISIYDDTVQHLIEAYSLENDIELEFDEVTHVECRENMIFKIATKHPLLSREEEKSLAIKISEGDKLARDKLIVHNLRLVINIAKKFYSKDLEFDDLIEYGIIGLIESIDKFDYTKGFKLSTFATYKIRQQIISAINNFGRTIKLSSYMQRDINCLKNVKEKLSSILLREPELYEIANEMNISVQKLRQIEKCTESISSLNYITDEGTELIEFVPSEDESTEALAEKGMLKVYFEEIFLEANLTDREKYVLLTRGGGEYDDIPKLSEIASEYGVTGECIRRVEARGLEKMTRKISKELALYMYHPEEAVEKLLTKRSLYMNSHGKCSKKFNKEVNPAKKRNEPKTMGKRKKVNEIFVNNFEYLESALSYLSENDKVIFDKRFGKDVGTRLEEELLNKKEKNRLHNIVIPYLKGLMASMAMNDEDTQMNENSNSVTLKLKS